MPTHNRVDVIEAAIGSVLRQTAGDFELLVVADGCTDDTADRVSRIGDARIRLFDLPKAPYFGYANRNIALREARGRYVAFAAHDDLLLPDHLARLTSVLETSGKEWVYSRPLWVSTDGVIVPSGTTLTNGDELEDFLTRMNTIPASCVMYPRACLDRYGYWPEDVPSAADWVHWRTIIEAGGRANFTYDPEPTCLHFSANWRQSRHAGVQDVRMGLQIADTAGWWPRTLRYAVPPNVPEQHVVAAAMASGGAEWVSALRAAVRTVLDRLAWDDLRAVRPRLEAVESELRAERTRADALERELEDARSRNAALETALAAAHTSWRRAPARLLRRILR
jgi:hypothetical protein